MKTDNIVELVPLVGDDVKEWCLTMYHKTIEDNKPHFMDFNGVMIVMSPIPNNKENLVGAES